MYKDWDSFQVLLQNLKKELGAHWTSTGILVVDDFSLQPIPDFVREDERLQVLELVRNLGHQKAITIGLAHAVNAFPRAERFVVMDSDGEDKPEDVLPLLQNIQDKRFGLCFAYRARRTEGSVFRFLYRVYKRAFLLLTGQHIYFGNFCGMNAEVARRLVHVSEIWLHFSSGIIKSKIPYTTLPTHRGNRYKGASKMNFTSLINHGLSAIAVYSEFVAVRIAVLSLILSVVAGVGILSIFGIKQFSHLAIPGWASFVVLALIILIIQFFSLGLLLSFTILSAKTIKNINPSAVYKDYVFKIHQAAFYEHGLHR